MIYGIIVALLFALELAYIKFAGWANVIDRPNQRSSHSAVTLRGGGVVFLFGIWLYEAFFGINYEWFVAGLTLAGVVSFIDDNHELSKSLRLIVQVVAMLFMFYQLDVYSIYAWPIGLLALIVCVGIVNAYNFMDGINGITAGYSIAVLLPLIYLNYRLDFVSMPLLYVTGLSLLVFCVFNFRKRAICFAGDVGSITIAFILLFAIARLILKTGDYAYLALLLVYGVDSVLTICHRIMLHENIFQAHRKHAYQLMANELCMSHVRVSLIYACVQLAISAGMIFCPFNHHLYLIGMVILLVALYIFFMKRNYHLYKGE